MVTPVPLGGPLKVTIVIDHNLLHRELVSFAGTLTTDFDLSEQLHALVVTAAAAMGVDGAGITLSLPSGGTQYIAASDPTTLHVEQRQEELQQGACVDAIASSEVVAASDLTVEDRWPDFRPVLLQAGFVAAAGVPVRFRGENIGAVNLYANDSRAWTTDEFTCGRLIADLAAGYLINSYMLRHSETVTEQLQQALDSRVVIEQAKGVLAGRHGVTTDAAFALLRDYSRSNRTKLHGVAAGVVAGEILVPEATGTEQRTSSDH